MQVSERNGVCDIPLVACTFRGWHSAFLLFCLAAVLAVLELRLSALEPCTSCSARELDSAIGKGKQPN